MTMDPNAGLAGAGRRLEALQAKLDRAVRGARARNAIMLLLGVVALGLMGYFLWKANQGLTKWDAETVAYYGEGQIRDSLPSAAAELKSALRASAPDVVNEGERRLRELPDQFAARLHEDLGRELAEQAPKVEDELYEALTHGLAEADKNIAAAGGEKGDDEARFKAALGVLVHVYGTESGKLLDKLHARYREGSHDILARLDRLAEGKDLDAQEQSQRTMIRNFLILAREYHDQSTGAAAVNVVRTGNTTTAPTTNAPPDSGEKTTEAEPAPVPAEKPAEAAPAPEPAPAEKPADAAPAPAPAEKSADAAPAPAP